MDRSFDGVRRGEGKRRVAAMLAVAIGAAGPAAGATYLGSAANTNWNDPANWTPGVPAEGEDVIIADVTAQNTLTLNDGPHAVGLFQFGDTGTRALSAMTPVFAVAAPAANALTINGGLTALSGVATSTGVSLNLSAPVVIQGDQTWSIGGSAGTPTSDQGVAFPSSANAITFNGKITKTGTGQLLFIGRTFGDGSIDVAAGSVKLNAGSTALLTVNGTGTITVGTGTAGTGAMLIVSKNSGTLSMTKAVAVNAGTISVGGNNATGTPGTFNIASPVSWAGTNTLNQTSDTANLVANFSGTWTGSGIIATTIAGAAGATGRYVVISGNNAGLSARFQNAVTLAVGSDTALGTGVYRSNGGSVLRAADMTARVVPNVIDVASSTTFGSAAADGTPTSGNLTFTATGSGTSDSGTVTGIATGSGAKTLTVLNARTTFSGTVTGGASANAITKAGAGLLELSGLNTYNRPTTIAAGTLQVTGSGRLGAVGNAQPVTVADAGLLDLQAAGLSDAASLNITSTDPAAEVNVGAGVNDVVNMLFVNGVAMTPGTYGSTASGATNPGFALSGVASPDEVFSGTGVLTVLTIPEPGSVGLLGAVAGLLAARRRRTGKA
jgi:fibronectin-binding autotransporter adhesin